MPSKESSKYISVFVLIAALLPILLAFDLPVQTPAFSPSYVSIPPVSGDGSISAPPLSISIAPSSEAQAPAPPPESVIVYGGEDVNSRPEASYSAPPPSYTEEKTDPQAPAPSALNDGGEQTIANPKVLPFEYRAEDEPVDPYPKEETHGGVNGAVAGVMVGVGVVGLAGFVYHKKKKSNNVRAQYQYLGKNNMKKSVSL